jgi:hypothetical protein
MCVGSCVGYRGSYFRLCHGGACGQKVLSPKGVRRQFLFACGIGNGQDLDPGAVSFRHALSPARAASASVAKGPSGFSSL